jgi:two-component system nitrogen regulation response regulator NtrX
MVENDMIDVSDLPSPYNAQTSDISNISDLQLLSIDSLKDAKKSFEKEFIHKKLLEHDNNVSKTAKAIGVERSSLHKLIKRNLTKQESAGDK